MHSIRTKVLETQFKNSTAKLQQALKRAKYKLDVDALGTYCSYYTTDYINANACFDAFQKSYNTKGKNRIASYFKYSYDLNRSGKIHNFNNTKVLASSSITPSGVEAPLYYQSKMLDGTYIGQVVVIGQFRIVVDINGEKGPNKFGHDILYFYVNPKTDALEGYKWNGVDYSEDQLNQMNFSSSYLKHTQGNPCSKTSEQAWNGIGCSWYALHDICPFDNKPGYFRCLPK